VIVLFSSFSFYVIFNDTKTRDPSTSEKGGGGGFDFTYVRQLIIAKQRTTMQMEKKKKDMI